MTLTKNLIIDSIYKNTGLKKVLATQAFQSLMGIMKKCLESGEDTLISGFGKFYVKGKKERRGRNPQTGENMTLEGRRVVTFNCSAKLKEKLNAKKRKRKKRLIPVQRQPIRDPV